MGLWDDKVDNSYDDLFDYDRDGNLDSYERSVRDLDFWDKVEENQWHDGGEDGEWTPSPPGYYPGSLRKKYNEDHSNKSINKEYNGRPRMSGYNTFCILVIIIELVYLLVSCGG